MRMSSRDFYLVVVRGEVCRATVYRVRKGLPVRGRAGARAIRAFSELGLLHFVAAELAEPERQKYIETLRNQ